MSIRAVSVSILGLLLVCQTHALANPNNKEKNLDIRSLQQVQTLAQSLNITPEAIEPLGKGRKAKLPIGSWETGILIVEDKTKGDETQFYFKYPIINDINILGNEHLCKQVCTKACGRSSFGDMVCRIICVERCVHGNPGDGDPRKKSIEPMAVVRIEIKGAAASEVDYPKER